MKIIKAQIKYFILGKKWKAIYSLNDQGEQNTSMIEKLAMIRVTYLIEKEQIELEYKQSESNTIDVILVYEFKK